MRSTSHAILVCSTAIFLVAASFATAQEVSKEKADEALKSFRKKIVGAKEEKIQEAFKELEGVRHETVLKELLKWAEKSSTPRDVKVEGNEEQGFQIEAIDHVNPNWEAIKVIQTDYKGNEEAAKGIARIMRSLAGRKPRDAKERPILREDLSALLDCFAELGCKTQATELVAILRHSEKVVVATAALAAGKLKSQLLIEPLIAALAACEARNEDEPFLPEEIKRGLGQICGITEEKAQKMGSADWKTWWKENKESFKEPE